MNFYDYIALSSFILFLAFFLFNRKLENNRLWNATVPPLASIIGSGYLIAAPLLYYFVGSFAVIAMLGIVILAYLIGEAIRFNIKHEEFLFKKKGNIENKVIHDLEGFSNVVLAFAYMISVAFYLKLLASFLFTGFFKPNDFLENLLTTFILLFIGIGGYLKGLDFLTFLDKYGVALNLSIILASLVTLFFYDFHHFSVPNKNPILSFETIQLLAGILLIVQGFEVSKYIGEKYSKEERIKSMKLAQIISGIIYVAFIILILPLLPLLNGKKLDDTAIIFLASSLSFILGLLYKLGPLVSQFTAAIADTISSGGLIYEETSRKISSRLGYLLISLIDIVLIWSLNIFHIIAYASKAFAFYYALQSLIASLIALKLKSKKHFAFFLSVSIICFIIAIIAKSAE